MTAAATTRDEQKLREHLLDYVAYVLTAAAGLYREPIHYGPMRADGFSRALEEAILQLVQVSQETVRTGNET